MTQSIRTSSLVRWSRLLPLTAVVLFAAATAFAAPNVVNATQKGSLIVFPDIRIDTTAGIAWNTLVRIENDGSSDVDLKCYWMDGNKNRVDFGFTITRNQPVWFEARTGQGSLHVNPFPHGFANGFDNPYLLTPPSVNEAADGLGPYFKGSLTCFAVDAGAQNQVKWNHLSGTATVFSTAAGAYEYNAYAFFVPTGIDLQPIGAAGTLSLDGLVYDACPLYQIGQFTPVQ